MTSSSGPFMVGMLVFKVAEITYRERREQTLQILPVFFSPSKIDQESTFLPSHQQKI
jgi:hypothetical protein